MSEKPTILTYLPLVSKDRTLLVQVFIDPETNLIVQATRPPSIGELGDCQQKFLKVDKVHYGVHAHHCPTRTSTIGC